MTKIDLTYDIVNYTPATATPVDANFDRLEQHVNQELVERDGTVAMRAQLKLIGDPINDLDAAPKQYVDQVLPIGIVMMYGGAGTPPGGKWAVCNGAELQTAEYSELYNVIGHNFSAAGTPGSRFNLPNLSNRMPIGGGTIAAIGKTGGSKDASVIIHNHHVTHDHGLLNTTSAGGHDHDIGFNRQDNTSAGGTLPRLAGAGSSYTHTTAAAPAHYHQVNLPPSTVNASTVGTAGTNLNLPPYLGIQFVIRVK